eukprot:2524805-Rhodomonas_salina.1
MEADWPNCPDTLKLSLQWRALRKSTSSDGIQYPWRMLHTTCSDTLPKVFLVSRYSAMIGLPLRLASWNSICAS